MARIAYLYVGFYLISLASAFADNHNTESTTLKEISVTATRSERLISETAPSVSIISNEIIEKNHATNIKELVRYEPGVSVSSDHNRRGTSGFTIRGIDGNRVLILLDGVRIPDQYSGNGVAISSRDVVDLDSLKRVEIVRGPSSSLYGSDALGGVVAYTTKNPSDYLKEVNQPWYLNGKLSYSGANQGIAQTITAAGQHNSVGSLLTYTHRNSEETKNMGANNTSGLTRTLPNPQEISSNNLTGKITFGENVQNRFNLIWDLYERDVRTDILNAVTPTIQSQIADDKTQRQRISIGQDYTNSENNLFQKAQWLLYWQNTKSKEHVDEFRFVTGTNRLRASDFKFIQDIVGGEFQMETNFENGLNAHRLIYGADINYSETSRPRDRTEFNFTAGTSTKNIAGEIFPNKAFPDTNTTRLGLFIQDEIDFNGKQFTLIPGVRYDYYKMTPHIDTESQALNTSNFPLADISDSAISPKLGLIYPLNPQLSLFGQYARGFRSPPYDSANLAFTNFAQGYEVFPNANLKAETSNSYEIGLRGQYQAVQFGTSIYDNRYHDFIDNVLVNTTDTNSNGVAQEFQARNISKVRIYGFEAKADFTLNSYLTFLSTLAYAKGQNISAALPLDSVDPMHGTIGVRYSPNKRIQVEAITTLVKNKEDVSSATLFKTPGYGKIDILGLYQINKQAKINWGVFNIGNKKYWQWTDLRGLLASDAGIDRYTQPGRYVSASFQYTF